MLVIKQLGLTSDGHFDHRAHHGRLALIAPVDISQVVSKPDIATRSQRCDHHAGYVSFASFGNGEWADSASLFSECADW